VGGYGSGHYYRSNRQPTIEEHVRAEIGYLSKRGYLQPGIAKKLSWSCNGEPSGSISVKGGSNMVIFRYTSTPRGGESEGIELRIQIVRTHCHFGGSRPWFICPGCYKRVGVLVCRETYFVCRICSKLRYACQQESKLERTSRRIRKIQRRLGSPDWYNVLEPWFPKPKGMHWNTYNRIVEKADLPLRKLQAQLADMRFLGG
jgi:hypothetical protein